MNSTPADFGLEEVCISTLNRYRWTCSVQALTKRAKEVNLVVLSIIVDPLRKDLAGPAGVR